METHILTYPVVFGHHLYQRLADVFCQGQGGPIFGFVSHVACVGTVQFYNSTSSAGQGMQIGGHPVPRNRQKAGVDEKNHSLPTADLYNLKLHW